VFDDREEGGRVLATLAANDAIEIGMLRDKHNRVFAIYHRGGDPVHSISNQVHVDTAFVEGSRLHVWRLVRHDGEDLGTIFLQARTDELARRFTATLIVILILTAVAGAVFVRAAGYLQKAVSEPLLTLARVTQDIAAESHSRTRIASRGRDEVGVLTQRFNDMAEQLHERDREIHYYRDWLEVRVEERTQELTAAKTLAEDASRAKSEFLANMSHELRTPLHGVLSFADLGNRRATGDPKLGEYFERIHASGSRLLRLVNDLLDLAKLEAGRREFSFATYAVDEVVASVVDELHSLFGARGLALELAPSDRVDAMMDREAIMQVIRNLLSNAMKFSSTGNSIEVSVQDRNGAALITVSDRGPGIPEEQLETIFDQFVQSKLTKTQAGGTGLGLAISRELISGHGGRIWAENRPGGGATFFVELLREGLELPGSGQEGFRAAS